MSDAKYSGTSVLLPSRDQEIIALSCPTSGAAGDTRAPRFRHERVTGGI